MSKESKGAEDLGASKAMLEDKTEDKGNPAEETKDVKGTKRLITTSCVICSSTVFQGYFGKIDLFRVSPDAFVKMSVCRGNRTRPLF